MHAPAIVMSDEDNLADSSTQRKSFISLSSRHWLRELKSMAMLIVDRGGSEQKRTGMERSLHVRSAPHKPYRFPKFQRKT
jgi:hypothetical protein